MVMIDIDSKIVYMIKTIIRIGHWHLRIARSSCHLPFTDTTHMTDTSSKAAIRTILDDAHTTIASSSAPIGTILDDAHTALDNIIAETTALDAKCTAKRAAKCVAKCATLVTKCDAKCAALDAKCVAKCAALDDKCAVLGAESNALEAEIDALEAVNASLENDKKRGKVVRTTQARDRRTRVNGVYARPPSHTVWKGRRR